MKKKLLIIIPLLIISCVGLYFFLISSVSSNKEEVEFIVESGSTYYDTINKLKQDKMIRSEFAFKIYLKLNKVSPLEAGTYKLNKSMNVKEIVETFNKGNSYNPNAIRITFKEGENMRSIAKVIASNTNNKEEDVYNLLNDKEYLNSLINKYWFITDSILNEDIYYSLEGYLFPNTYEFNNKDVKVEEIFSVMLNEMDKRLKGVKNKIDSHNYNIHEIITLASIVEKEGTKNSDRAGIAGVFYKRLSSGWSLGSDVTTYYAAKVELSERDLYIEEINSRNAYNTRSDYLAGKLPVGPICNPSIDSINAALNPAMGDYYYFVADKNGKTYFTKTYNEHLAKKDELIKAGLWYTYE